MGRRAKGFGVHLHKSGYWYVRFTHAGHRYDLSTRTRDKEEAYREAPKIYAREIAAPRRVAPTPGDQNSKGGMTIMDAGAEWLASVGSSIDPLTYETYERYLLSDFHPFFGTVSDIVPRHGAFITEQLKRVQRPTLLKKLSGLRGLVRWALGDEVADSIRSPAKKATGTVVHDRKVTELAPATVKKFLRAVEGRYHAREYFGLMYETSLRPATLQGLSVPEHYARGRSELRIPKHLDKARYDRDVPLSPGARKMLDRIAPARGLIFGAHDYTDALERACARTGIARFTPYDLRHAFGTHETERSGNLPGVAYLMGHKNVGTTHRYIHPSKRAALEVLKKRGKK